MQRVSRSRSSPSLGYVGAPIVVDPEEAKRKAREALKGLPLPKTPGEIIDLLTAMPPWMVVLVVYGGLRLAGYNPLRNL